MCTYTPKHPQEGGDYRCSRPAEYGEYCILHADFDRKPLDLFLDEVEKILTDPTAEDADLTGAKFPNKTNLFANKDIHKRIVLDEAEFQHWQSFAERHFHSECSFVHAIFKAGADFSNCWFDNKCDFSGTVFSSRASFKDSTFSDTAGFGGCRFLGLADFSCSVDRKEFQGDVSFEGASFSGEVSFRNRTFRQRAGLCPCDFSASNPVFHGAVFRGPTVLGLGSLRPPLEFKGVRFLGNTQFDSIRFKDTGVLFEECDMEGAHILTLAVLEGKVTFNNCTWPRKHILSRVGRWGSLAGRYRIADESGESDSKEKVDSLRLLKLYRQLHKYYYDKSEFKLAGDFYVGFMMVKGKVEKAPLAEKIANFLYRLLSQYGESIWRPLVPLLAMWLFAPCLLGGIDQAGESYFERSIFNLRAWTRFFPLSQAELARISSGHQLLLIVEAILSAVFLAFLALGIRRYFAPKKPV